MLPKRDTTTKETANRGGDSRASVRTGKPSPSFPYNFPPESQFLTAEYRGLPPRDEHPLFDHHPQKECDGRIALRSSASQRQVAVWSTPRRVTVTSYRLLRLSLNVVSPGYFVCFRDVDHDVLPDDFYICSSSPNLSSQLQTHVFACLVRQDTEALYAPQGPPKTRHLTLPNLLLYLLPQLKAFPSNLLVKLKAPQDTVKRKASHRRGVRYLQSIYLIKNK